MGLASEKFGLLGIRAHLCLFFFESLSTPLIGPRLPHILLLQLFFIDLLTGLFDELLERPDIIKLICQLVARLLDPIVHLLVELTDFLLLFDRLQVLRLSV